LSGIKYKIDGVYRIDSTEKMGSIINQMAAPDKLGGSEEEIFSICLSIASSSSWIRGQSYILLSR
jgi:hypothetical protein